MTKARFTRAEKEQTLRLEGHQQRRPGDAENVYCAAVSAIMGTLLCAVDDDDVIEVATGDGVMMITAKRTVRTDAMYDMAVTGLLAFEANYPGRLTITTYDVTQNAKMW